MRIDQLMKKLMLVKSRSVAKKACELGLVKINDKICKASAEVRDNDIIEYEIYGYKSKVRILEIPKGNVSKKNAAKYYEFISKYKMIH